MFDTCLLNFVCVYAERTTTSFANGINKYINFQLSFAWYLQYNGALNALHCCCPTPGMQVESIPQVIHHIIKFVCSLVHEQHTVIKSGYSCQRSWRVLFYITLRQAKLQWASLRMQSYLVIRGIEKKFLK